MSDVSSGYVKSAQGPTRPLAVCLLPRYACCPIFARRPQTFAGKAGLLMSTKQAAAALVMQALA
jgi:hypothetical protein